MGSAQNILHDAFVRAVVESTCTVAAVSGHARREPAAALDALCRAISTPVHIASVRGGPEHALTPFGLAQSLVLELCGIEPDNDPERLRDRLATGLRQLGAGDEETRVVARLIGASGELGGEPVLRKSVLNAMVSILRVATQSRPVLLLIEDLHACDRDSIQLLFRVTHRCRSLPLFLAFTSTPLFIDRGCPWTPGVLIETDDAQTPAADDESVVRRHFSALPETQRRLLATAAVLGPTFWSDCLPEAGGPADADATLGALCLQNWISRLDASRFPDTLQYRFEDEDLRLAAAATLSEVEATAIHHAAAEWMIVNTITDPGRWAAWIADHFERAGELEQAGDWYVRAGRHAMTLGAMGAAEEHLQAALLLLPDTGDLADLRLLAQEELVNLRRATGTDREVLDTIQAWREDAHHAGNVVAEARACLAEGEHWLEAGDVAQAEPIVAKSVALARVAADEALLATAANWHAVLLYRLGRYHDSAKSADDALSAALMADAKPQMVAALTLLAETQDRLDRETAARGYRARAMQVNVPGETRRILALLTGGTTRLTPPLDPLGMELTIDPATGSVPSRNPTFAVGVVPPPPEPSDSFGTVH